ncbi:type II toxin-antitoxin system VapC family toxin [Phytoactinopolyspora limicola]|uniref:type II toxin-antitoxin system VapC family toxin n=1 Tax=Phytoactinopolyspora limicola TaxID=2715536 RepID=UPI00140B6211|nr:PIN domain-containing protein [Phytoactinopolyspora limicola]
MIVDTGPLVAAANRKDPDHEACRELLANSSGTLVVPALVVAEATFMIERAGGSTAEARFLRSLQSRRYKIEPPTDSDLGRCVELVEKYADLPLGGTDASVAALAERLNETTIATLDHRHFTVVRPKHVPAFTLMP